MSTHLGEDIKGRVKEAAGAVADDDELRREGKADQAAATVKDKIGDAVDKVKDFFTHDQETDRT